MKMIVSIVSLLVLPMLLLAQTTQPIGDTKNNGIVIFSQQSELAQKNKQFVQAFFTWLNHASKNTHPINKKDFLTYFDSHVIYTVNGKVLAFDATHLQSRFAKLKKTYAKIDVLLPVKSLVIAGNHVAVHYQIKIENAQHQNYIDDVAVQLTLHKQKITAWTAIVAHHE